MKNARTKILVGLVLLIAVMLITGIAWGKATKTPVTGTTLVYPRGIAEKEWIDDDGILHIRGGQADYIFLGELTGTGVGVVNLNIDPIMGIGDESGYSISELTWGELKGTFQGSFSVTYTYGIGIGHGVYHGTGDFAGMKLMEDFTVDLTTPEPYIVNFEGIVLDPHGE